MYIDFSMKFIVYAISIKVTQHKLANPFMRFDSAATKPGKPVPADGAWTKTAEVAFPAVSRSSWLVIGSSGVTFHSCFIHLLITFCQILWGWNFLSGAGPCMPKGKFFWRVSARTIKSFLSRWRKKFFTWISWLQFTRNSKFNPVTQEKFSSLSLSLLHTPNT